ncbi:MAG: hypothetical protein ABI543_04335 [Ignavibacteria bacterium]
MLNLLFTDRPKGHTNVCVTICFECTKIKILDVFDDTKMKEEHLRMDFFPALDLSNINNYLFGL